MTFHLSDDQVQDALTLCERFPPRTGMYVRPPSWSTIDAFLGGYVASWPDGGYRALQEFTTNRLGPSNIVWSSRLHSMYDPDVDRNADLGRDGGEVVANLLCSVIRDFVQEQATRS